MRLYHSFARRAKFWLLALLSIAALVAVLILALGSSRSEDAVRVNLNDRAAVAPVQQDGGEALSTAGNDSLRVAIAGVLSASETLEAYHELLTYMGDELNRRVDLILKPTYAEINDLIAGQGVDAAFVCSLAYVEGSQNLGMEILVAPKMYGGTVYYSYLIVPAESSAATLEDLRGASFACTDPMSNTGHLNTGLPAFSIE
ncbi:MAG: PhnD/SsuA/transferrin family substrate-binding protein [Dehalococcoidia bacterium]